MANKGDRVFTATLKGATRAGGSSNGNPTWKLHTSDGDYLTNRDGQIGYDVANRTGGPGSWIGREVTFTATRAGRVYDWQPASETDAGKAVAFLRELFPAGSTVSTTVLHVSTSGMTRAIAVWAHDEDAAVQNVSWAVARAIGGKLHGRAMGVEMHGAGMDMAYALVVRLSRALYGSDDELTKRSV